MLMILEIFLFGLIEGITEWLPISSTGHMILLDAFLHPSLRPEFWNIFLYVIQFGAILAVVTIYFKKLNPLDWTKTKEERKMTWYTWYKVLIGCLPAAVIGLLLNDYMEEHFQNWLVVSIALIVYGILFIIVENRNKTREVKIHNIQEMTIPQAIKIGLFQALSIVPGTSRSGSSILGATILGADRTLAADYSFFMSIPIMVGISILKIGKAVVIDGFSFTGTELFFLLYGMIVAYIISILTIKMFLTYIKGNDFKAFGWYRIGIGLVVILIFNLFL